MKPVMIILAIVATGAAAKDGLIDTPELFIVGLAWFVALFTNPGGDHKNEG